MAVIRCIEAVQKKKKCGGEMSLSSNCLLLNLKND